MDSFLHLSYVKQMKILALVLQRDTRSHRHPEDSYGTREHGTRGKGRRRGGIYRTVQGCVSGNVSVCILSAASCGGRKGCSQRCGHGCMDSDRVIERGWFIQTVDLLNTGEQVQGKDA